MNGVGVDFVTTVTKLILTPFILIGLPAFAGRPLTTDDAATIDADQCQLEAWADHGPDTSLGWLVPSCNFGLGIEWQAGFARSRSLGAEHFSEGYVQAKKVLRAASEESPWALGATVGVTRRPLSPTHRGWQHPYVIVPVTVTAGDFTFHASPGWTRNPETGHDASPWGVAMEWAANGRLDLVAETFGEGPRDPFVRAGLRWAAIKDTLWFDLTQVARTGGTRNERAISLGFTWILSFAR